MAQSWGWRGEEGSGRLQGAAPSAWVLLRPLARRSLLLAPSVNCLPPILSRPLGHHQRRDRRSCACFILVGTVSVQTDVLVPVVLCLPPQVILTRALGAIWCCPQFRGGRWGGCSRARALRSWGTPLQGRGCRGPFLQRPLPFLAGRWGESRVLGAGVSLAAAPGGRGRGHRTPPGHSAGGAHTG